MARKAANPLIATSSSCDFCPGKVTWRNDRMAVCPKCYAEKVAPHVRVGPTDIAVQKRIREVNEWISKHPEFSTKRLACLHLLKKRGLLSMLPPSLR